MEKVDDDDEIIEMIPPTLSSSNIHDRMMHMNTDHHHHSHQHHQYHHPQHGRQNHQQHQHDHRMTNNQNNQQQQQLVKCTLDNDQCLNLANILQSFQTAINEEQAWALCYQIVKCFRQYYQPTNNNNNNTSHHNHQNCYLVTDPSHVHLHKDGYVHPKTLYQKTNDQGKSRTLAKSSHKLLTSLGIVLFHALDYGLCDDEERTLSKPLELLIERLTTAHELASRHHHHNHDRQKSSIKRTTRKRKFNDKKCSAPTTVATSSISAPITSTTSTTARNDNQMSSIGSICLDDDDNDDHHDHDDDIVMEDNNDYDDDNDDDFDDDDDECAMADEGIEQDCHEYSGHETTTSLNGSPPSTSSSTITSSSLPGYNHCRTNNKYLLNFDHVMQMCVSRLSCQESADNHYKAVCRALLAETLELSTFLDQIAKGTKELRKSSVLRIESSSSSSNNNNLNNIDDNDDCTTLERLQFHDWARLWIQVIRELRHGVKLKKVNYQQDSIFNHHQEYELTPYEMLLDDIRSRRYKLNKVMINGDLPQRLKKDAHELILDFIRSRPPLVPVSNRVLKPAPPKQVTIYEKLMDSIRQQEHRLRPTSTKQYSFSANVTPLHFSTANENNGKTTTTTTTTMVQSTNNSNQRLGSTTTTTVTRRKKVIKADIKLDLFLDDDDDDNKSINNNDDDDEEIIVEIPTTTTTKRSTRSTRPMSAYFSSEIQSSLEHHHYDEDDDEIQNENNESNDLIIDDDDNKPFQRLKKLSNQFFAKERRHSISVCDLSTLEKYQQQQQQQNANDIIDDLDFDEDHRNHVAAIWEKNDFGKSLECLSLTLKEVQHIRSVLTKAEIESLGVTKSLKKDLENGKICFTCLKTRFTFWGPWATICKLCNRSICDRCATKMHIPTEQFDRVPIYMLSPTPSPPNEKHVLDMFKFANNKDHHHHNHHGDNNREKQNEKPEEIDNNENNESKSLPTKLNSSRNRMTKLMRMLLINNNNNNRMSQQNNVDDNDDNDANEDYHYHGPLVKVCRDCKILVRHLINIGHTNFNGVNFQSKSKSNQQQQQPTMISTD
ncbi:protein spire homolog 1-like isoform X2 [Dermatophagoides pteronyssinus]|uniref:protein spire homolog 1-like isoform X2 n=1 Tax=Dermatophagoides pteronyssinus TaxID=6956 RepID=UPI003F6808A6